MSQVLLLTRFDFINERCQIDFIYPGDNDDLRSLTSYADLYSCEVEHFTIPNVVNVSHKVKEACESRLASPYGHREMFANVFSHICSAKIFSSNFQCKRKTC